MYLYYYIYNINILESHHLSILQYTLLTELSLLIKNRAGLKG